MYLRMAQIHDSDYLKVALSDMPVQKAPPRKLKRFSKPFAMEDPHTAAGLRSAHTNWKLQPAYGVCIKASLPLLQQQCELQTCFAELRSIFIDFTLIL